ncbi:MAG: RNA polymerase sigma-70 factor [Dysgonamonadaceae bacterium]|jgi:RNA polymerase sigma-70 factor (ECF subfamily)|nr:RNA polymerase sigma-70 factor [Dysgonamonadaceae bacterium]
MMNCQPETERDILSRLREGSPEAFEKLFHKYAEKLYNFVLKLSSGDTYRAEEIVQNTFVRVWEMHACLNPDKSFISYLCTIARNKLIDEYEHRTIEYIYREYILKYCSVSDNTTEKETDRNLLEEYIDCLIDKLPPGRKQVFILSRKEMLSNKEIAERLRISESTVQTQLSKAVSFMREHLSKYYECMVFIWLIHIFVN